MITVPDVGKTLDLDLNRDAPTAAGYFIRNHKGLDIAVMAFPKNSMWTMGGAGPACYVYFEDSLYDGRIVCSPLPIKRKDVLKIDDVPVTLSTRDTIPENIEAIIFSKDYIIKYIKDALEGIEYRINRGIRVRREQYWQETVQQATA